MRECGHCHMDIEIRNPSGFCDHLYYPEQCDVCKKFTSPDKSEKPLYEHVAEKGCKLGSAHTGHCTCADEILNEKSSEAEGLRAKFDKAVKDLDAQLAIQEDEPSTQTDPYMCGLLNGMLLAKSDLTGCEYNPQSYKDEALAKEKAHSKRLEEACRQMIEWLKTPMNLRAESDLKAIIVYMNEALANGGGA